MLFFRAGRSSQRHRRVLHDTLLTTPVTLATGVGRRRTSRSRYAHELYVGQSENYGDAMLLESQTRLTDLVPMHPMILALVLIAGFGAVLVLVGLYVWMSQSGQPMGRIAALDLADRGSLASWFCSLTLALAAATAGLVYTVRRHRLDDYRGHYRIWLWSATCWFLLSIDATANLHDGFGQLMVWLTGTRLFGGPATWWLVVFGFVIAAVSLRLLVDMRHCWPSAAALVATAICFTISLAFHFGCVPVEQLKWPPGEPAVRAVAINKGAVLSGSFLLLTAMIWHARYVILDAEGLLPRKRRRRGRTSEEVYMIDGGELVTSGGGTVRVHPPHGVVVSPSEVVAVETPAATPVVASTPAVVVASAAQAAPLTTTVNGVPVQRRLTKQEKKALKARLERMRAERGRQAG